MQRILVTGGAGFLGSHLCDRLLAAGHHVICLDSFQTGRRANIAHLAPHPRFELIEGCVTVPRALDVQRIYNLACPASPPRYQADPLGTIRTSVLGAMAMLDLARQTGARILQASTSEIYGDPAVHPQPESYRGNVNPIGPRACYDEGKRCAESLFFDHRRVHGTDIKVVRIFNTYGPRMDPQDGRAVSNFIVQALSGAALSVHGDGSQTRAFCYVDDLIDGLVAMMDTPEGVTGPVNLGNPHEVTIRELASTVLALAGSGAPLGRLPAGIDDPRRRCPDIALAQALWGFAPATPLREGLARTLAHIRTELAAQPGG